MTTVALIDGSKVDSASEAWRHECEARHVANLPTREARHVANLPTREARQGYLAFVQSRRGGTAGKQLEALAARIYNTKARGAKR